MPESYLIRGILIGLVFGIPAGAIGALAIQRTLSHGFIAGFFTGLGSSFADLLYAVVGVLGITIVSDFLLAHQTTISVIGGALIVGLGVFIFKKKGVLTKTNINATQLSQFFCTSFVIAITNPATIMTLLIAFTSFGIVQSPTLMQGIQLIFGILVGTCCWWGFLSGIVAIFRSKVTDNIYKRLNQILGIIMFLIGMVMIARVTFT